jgi:anti-anti-sigma factor
MLELHHQIYKGVLVLKPHKRIDQLTASSFEEQSAALLTQGHNKVAVDCSALEYISSAGLRAWQHSQRSSGGEWVWLVTGDLSRY